MNKDQLVLLILDKQEEIEKLQAKLRDQNGHAIIAKIVCKDSQSAKRVHDILLNTIHTATDWIECGVVDIVDESKVECVSHAKKQPEKSGSPQIDHEMLQIEEGIGNDPLLFSNTCSN